VSLFVDTSVWSLALRRDGPSAAPQVIALVKAIANGEPILTTGLMLQELLQGFSGPKIASADSGSVLRASPPRAPIEPITSKPRRFVTPAVVMAFQIGTIDALLAQLCIRHGLLMLSSDRDFQGIADHSALQLWQP
jgi:predicted nucleic acid-binding protein